MSHPSQTSDPMVNLIATLDLEKLEENLYRGESPQIGWQRVFGGQVIAQALIAAQRTVDDDRFVHSLHAYFMRPGDPLVPIVYQVERIRDGASFCTAAWSPSSTARRFFPCRRHFRSWRTASTIRSRCLM